MTNEEQKLREFVSKYVNDDNEPTFLSDLTALISEGYVSKEEYAEEKKSNALLHEAMATAEKRGHDKAIESMSELLQQRDELREALAEQKRLYFNLFDEEISCMYCEAKIRRGSAIILCKECAENTEI